MAQEELVGPKAYGREQVVEVVGDTAGQQAHRLHAVALGEARLHLLLFGDLLDIDQGPPASRGQVQMHRPLGRGRQGRLERAGAPGGALGPDLLQAAGVDDVLQARARPLARHGLQGGVGRRHHAGERILADDQGDSEGRRPRQRVEAWTVHSDGGRGRGFQPDQEQPLASHGDRGPPLIRRGRNLGPTLGAGAAQGQVQIPLRRQPAGGAQGFPPGRVGADDSPIEPGQARGLVQGFQQGGGFEGG